LKEDIMTSNVSKLVLAATALALPIQASAQECMKPNEAQALMIYAMPDVLDGVIKQCQPHLSTTGFIAKSGGDFVARYRTGSEASWPLAKIAFFKFAGKDATLSAMRGMPDSLLKGLISFGITTKATNDISSDDCGTVERLLEALAPLPPANTATVIAIAMEMGASKRSTKGKNDLSICPAMVPATASK
jgi:hypothetical protein